MPTPIDRPNHSGLISSQSSSSSSLAAPADTSSFSRNMVSTSSSSSCLPKFLRIMEEFEEDPGINIGHITASHNGYVILLSGFKGYKENSTAFYRPSEEIWVYDQIVEKWIKKICSTETNDEDDMPLERSSACATIINQYLYMFGGFSEEGNLNTLYRLDLDTLKWRRMKPTGRLEPLPCDKNVCWEYDEKFFLFGGYGPVPRIWSEDFNFQFIFDTSSHWHYVRGWNNQLVYYDPTINSWEWPQHSGQIPSARAACAASKIGHKVFLFGGRMNQERMNDMYLLDMKTLQWTQIQSNDVQHPVRGRSWHTLTPLSDQLLVLYGGFSHDNQPLKDCWIFDIRSYTWREVFLPFDKPRFWHSATLSLFGEILVLGGATEELNVAYHRNPKYNHIFAKDMFAIQFQPQSLFRQCLGVIANNLQLSERLFQILPTSLMEIVFKRCITNQTSLIKLKINHHNNNHDNDKNQNDDDTSQSLDNNKTINDEEMRIDEDQDEDYDINIYYNGDDENESDSQIN